ncbi:MAG: proton-conducting transporter membrane subunit [Planctomycetota bacterium]
MTALLLSPILIPLITSLLCFTFWKQVAMQRTLSLLSASSLLVVAIALLWHVASEGTASTQGGGWDAPFGITFVADTFGAIMVLLNALTAFAAVIYSLGSIDPRRERNGYHGLMQALICACSGAFLTGDLFNMYVWFEIMLMSSFVLLALGGERGQLEGGIKYVTLNMLSSVLFLAALGLLYGLVGTLNIADMSVKLQTVQNAPMVTAVAMLFLIAFGIKAAAFPFFFWLPASYHTPPAVISAVFAGLLTKVGVYSIVRVFTLVFDQETFITATLISVIAALTMVTGVLGAAAQFDIRRILSFHIVSQIGYMLMGLGVSGAALVKAREFAIGSPDHEALMAAGALSLAGTVFYILHHIIVKANLFLVAGIVERIKGSGNLKKIGGLYKANPYLALLFMIPAMSLAGIPILSGFWSKLVLIVGGVQAGTFGIVFVALLVSVLTLFSMTKIWAEAFWKPQPEGDPLAPDPEPAEPEESPRGHIGFQYGAVAFLATITVAIGLGSGPAFRLAEHAASELITGQDYVTAVLGPNNAPPPELADPVRAARFMPNLNLDEEGRAIIIAGVQETSYEGGHE